ncbi:hypothetical protein [Medusavirus stheno T3]|uniref:Uncharacterized protein n=1 Tax=Medusavirus stheno T3 TaxID=3069717 RepID=A0A7S7YEN7_9VIRU|nr:hypothetical protein QKU73_gp359 [Acanthamoeba castellanii medusavirus]QPB44416.1 hypothetical protein [Medusavirus stheno T3]
MSELHYVPLFWPSAVTYTLRPRCALPATPERTPGQSLVDYYVAHADHPSIAMFLNEVPCRDYAQWEELWRRHPDTKECSHLINTKCGCGSPEDYRETIEAALDFLFTKGGEPELLNEHLKCGDDTRIGEIVLAHISSYVDVPGGPGDIDGFMIEVAEYCSFMMRNDDGDVPFLPAAVREVLGDDISDGAMEVVLHHLDERGLAEHGTSVNTSKLHEDVIRRYAQMG